jgi:hypothetical protein
MERSSAGFLTSLNVSRTENPTCFDAWDYQIVIERYHLIPMPSGNPCLMPLMLKLRVIQGTTPLKFRGNFVLGDRATTSPAQMRQRLLETNRFASNRISTSFQGI